MKLLLTSAFTALLFGCALVESAPAARPGREVIKRSGTYGSSSDAGERPLPFGADPRGITVPLEDVVHDSRLTLPFISRN